MIAANAGANLFIAETEIPDPGASGTIAVQVSHAVCNLVSATAEARTLPLPDKENVVIALFARTVGGTITLTVTGGLDLAGTTTFAFTAVNQFLVLQSFRKADGTQIWLKIADHTNNSASASFTNATVTNLTATNGTIASLTTTNQSLSGAQTMAANANFAFNATNGTMFGTNNAQKMGFWGAAPVIQPAFTGELIGLNGNAATAANATNMNSNGNLGATNYTFNDLVKDLKTAGVIKT